MWVRVGRELGEVESGWEDCGDSKSEESITEADAMAMLLEMEGS